MNDEFDLQTELNRKSGEALAWLDNEHNRGAISDAEYALGLTMFDMTTLGLIDRDLSAWATDERVNARMLKGSVLNDKVVLVKGDKTLVVTLFRKTAALRIVAAPGMGIEPKRHTHETIEDAVTAFNKAVAALLSKGYEVLK